jgi:phospholipid transport system substrate-binding protein
MTMKSRRTFMAAAAFAAAAIGLGGSPSYAKTDLGAFVVEVADHAITALSSATATDAARAAALKPVLEQYFDMPGIAKHTLGAYWKKATPEQQQNYIQAFIDYMSVVYGQRFKEYNGEKLIVKRVREDGDKGTVFATVDSSDSQPPRVDWDVRTDGDRPLVTDIRVEGLSLAETHRQEFTSVISQNGGNVDALIAILHKKATVN